MKSYAEHRAVLRAPVSPIAPASAFAAKAVVDHLRENQADRPSEGPGRSEAAADSVRPNP